MTIAVTGRRDLPGAEEILTPDALSFLEKLHQRFAATRNQLLEDRAAARAEAAKTGGMDFLPETREVREADWQVAPAPVKLRDRRVEITRPVAPANMAINALNSGSKVWLADLEEAAPPLWSNFLETQ